MASLNVLFTVAVLDYDDDEGEGDEYYDDISDGGKGENVVFGFGFLWMSGTSTTF